MLIEYFWNITNCITVIINTEVLHTILHLLNYKKWKFSYELYVYGRRYKK